MGVIDLTMPVSSQLPAFPGSPGPQFIRWNSLRDSGYNMELMLCSTHTGTHIDAPYHFAEDGRTTDQIPPERLMRRACLITVPGRDVEVDDIAAFEESHSPIDGATIVFRTGWSDGIGPAYFERNPGMSADAARYVASKGVNLVGIDSPSIDPGALRDFPAHRVLAQSDIPVLENLINLGRIGGVWFDLVALPLNLRGATGSPVRAVAVLPTV